LVAQESEPKEEQAVKKSDKTGSASLKSKKIDFIPT
jgi:hypothetical protein